jgi:predicted flap endonuclease-1-like 5' DNA nuclease
MSEKMSKHEVISHIAEKTGVTRKVAGDMLDALVELAYQEAKNEFTIPGLGVVALSDRAARKMVMRFGPKAGQEIDVPAKKALKFRFSKAAREAILGTSTPAKKDDLVIIEGIGPKIAEAMNRAGIYTFKQLANTPVADLQAILSKAQFPGDPGTWPEQAKLAAEGRMDELKKLQDELQAGRRV